MTLLACWKKLSKKKLGVGDFAALIDKRQSKVPFNFLQNYKITLKTKVSFLILAKEMEDMTLDELDELEDEEEEKILEQYRQQRIAQIKSLQQKSR